MKAPVTRRPGRLGKRGDKVDGAAQAASDPPAMPAPDKDRQAFVALHAAGQHARAVATWAINHKTGLAIAGARACPDDHCHEHAGEQANRELARDPAQADPRMARALLIALLDANPGGFPVWLTRLTIEALEALDYGTTMPLFQRAMRKRKRSYPQLELQQQALRFVLYENGRGLSLEKARAQVGEEIGIDAETLHTWEVNVRAAVPNAARKQSRLIMRRIGWRSASKAADRLIEQGEIEFGAAARKAWRVAWRAAQEGSPTGGAKGGPANLDQQSQRE